MLFLFYRLSHADHCHNELRRWIGEGLREVPRRLRRLPYLNEAINGVQIERKRPAKGLKDWGGRRESNLPRNVNTTT
jgi:hypothetical protein